MFGSDILLFTLRMKPKLKIISSIQTDALTLLRQIKSHLPFANIIRRFNVYGSLHRKYIQQEATLHSLFISGNCSTCFGWYFHSSSGAHTIVSTASGICHNTVTTILHINRTKVKEGKRSTKKDAHFRSPFPNNSFVILNCK
jgi:hypothetical protein